MPCGMQGPGPDLQLSAPCSLLFTCSVCSPEEENSSWVSPVPFPPFRITTLHRKYTLLRDAVAIFCLGKGGAPCVHKLFSQRNPVSSTGAAKWPGEEHKQPSQLAAPVQGTRISRGHGFPLLSGCPVAQCPVLISVHCSSLSPGNYS